jgi:hypothetical protein
MLVFTGTRGGTSAAFSGGSDQCSTSGGRAGLARLWALPCAAVASITFNSNREVSAVSLSCDASTTDWQEIGFEAGTGQITQQQNGFNRYSQGISVLIDGQSSYNRSQINALSSCSCWHFIGLDESGITHYMGIHTYERGPLTLWESASMQAVGNAAQTGIAPENGDNQFLVVLSANGVNQIAPHAIGTPDRLSVPCSDNSGCGVDGLQSLAGECLTSLSLEILERI